MCSSDLLVIDYPGRTSPFVINFDGGEDVGDNDSLTVLGNNTQNVIYTPSATTNGDGVVTVGPSTINFSNL